MFKKIVLLPLVALSFNLAQPVFADEVKTPAASTCTCKPMDKMANVLNLDDNQVAQIKSIKAKARADRKANIEKLHAIRVQIKGLILSKTMDETQLDNLINQKTAILNAMMKARVISKNQIYNILNPKQQLAFQQMMKDWEKGTHRKCACKGHAS
ncbi:MAG: Spy/CpxP family protein refolding chaperone [Legionella sp.]|nr:Spy/CpxP family protein refolding chaperone [Legionella sp.]